MLLLCEDEVGDRPRLLRHGVRRRAACCGTRRCPASTHAERARDLRRDEPRHRRAAHGRRRRASAWPTTASPATTSSARSAAGPSSTRPRSPQPIEAMDRLIEWLPAHIPASARDDAQVLDRARRLPPRQPDLPRRPSRASSPCSTGSCRRSAIRSPTSATTACRGTSRRARSAASAASTSRRSASRPRSEYVRRYCERTGRADPDALMADWNFYLAYNLFRIAGILQGIAKRVEAGTASSEQARQSGRRRAAAGRAGLAVRAAAPERRTASTALTGDSHGLRILGQDQGAAERSCCASWTSTSTRPSSATRPRSRPTPRPASAGRRCRPIEELKPKARAAGLWNLFLPPTAGGRLGLRRRAACPTWNTRRWPRSWAACRGRREVFNCSAPDTGNMETIERYGTRRASRQRWLEPLLDGEIRSAFAMTEPAVASSDATNIEARIEREGDEYVINGRKWWISRRRRPALQDLHRHGQDRSRRAAPLAAVDDPGAGRHAGHHDRCARSPCSATTTRRTATWR